MQRNKTGCQFNTTEGVHVYYSRKNRKTVFSIIDEVFWIRYENICDFALFNIGICVKNQRLTKTPGEFKMKNIVY